MPIPPDRRRRAVGLDVGRARIGVAVTDVDAGMALPHAVVERKGTRQDLAQLLPMFDRLKAEVVVVGLPPVQDDADAGTSGLARRFAAAVAAAQARPVVLVDEADTTVEAAAELRALGMRAAKRRREVDKHAAARLLDRWLGGAEAEPVLPAGE